MSEENNTNQSSQKTEKRLRDNLKLYSFLCAVVVFVLFIVFLLFSNESKIFDISVSGNRYFDEQDIKDIANLNDNYFLNVPFLIESKLEKHPLIEDAEVDFLDGKIISIIIKEKKLIGYRLNDDGYFEVLTADNDTYLLKDDEIHLISYVPLIELNNEEKLDKFCKNMDDLEPDIISQISEINSYPFTYDPDMFEFVMADGNYCFVSLKDFNKIVDYYSVAFNIGQDKGHTCIFIEDFTISAYASTCPWQEQK